MTSLGSGSKGNATLIQCGDSLLLVDSGFSCKELVARMVARGVSPEQVTAVLVTHEHADHFNGVASFSKKFQIPVWMTAGTSLHKKAADIGLLNIFNCHQDFSLGEITVRPVSVPHDSREASQFVFIHQQQKVGILTDIGHITPFVTEQYQDCQLLLLEFNHDPEMLANGRYPQSLKTRVASGLGHLSNQQAADFLSAEIVRQLQSLVAMHLSEKNNHASLVEAIIEAKNLPDSIEVKLADQATGFDWIDLSVN